MFARAVSALIALLQHAHTLSVAVLLYARVVRSRGVPIHAIPDVDATTRSFKDEITTDGGMTIHYSYVGCKMAMTFACNMHEIPTNGLTEGAAYSKYGCLNCCNSAPGVLHFNCDAKMCNRYCGLGVPNHAQPWATLAPTQSRLSIEKQLAEKTSVGVFTDLSSIGETSFNHQTDLHSLRGILDGLTLDKQPKLSPLCSFLDTQLFCMEVIAGLGNILQFTHNPHFSHAKGACFPHFEKSCQVSEAALQDAFSKSRASANHTQAFLAKKSRIENACWHCVQAGNPGIFLQRTYAPSATPSATPTTKASTFPPSLAPTPAPSPAPTTAVPTKAPTRYPTARAVIDSR